MDLDHEHEGLYDSDSTMSNGRDLEEEMIDMDITGMRHRGEAVWYGHTGMFRGMEEEIYV